MKKVNSAPSECDSSSLPVCLQKAWKSFTEPGSVAITFRTWPAAKLYRVFRTIESDSLPAVAFGEGGRSSKMATHSYRDTLKQPGLQPFLWTQFLARRMGSGQLRPRTSSSRSKACDCMDWDSPRDVNFNMR